MMAEHIKYCHGSHTCKTKPIGHVLIEFPREPGKELRASLMPMCDKHLTERAPFYASSKAVTAYIVRWPVSESDRGD
jgi:hypothetical protein